MSKYVKNLVADHIRRRLAGVQDALLVNVIGMDAHSSNRLRSELRSKNINVLVVKNSLAARALAQTPLGPMFDGLTGTAAICWGGEDIVSLAKEITRLSEGDQYKPFATRGGALDGERLGPHEVVQVSKWPSRRQQLSILTGQILSPASVLTGQLTAAAAGLASQIEQRGKTEGEGPTESNPG